MSQKIDLAEKTNRIKTVVFPMAVVTKYGNFGFGSILHCCLGGDLDNVLPWGAARYYFCR